MDRLRVKLRLVWRLTAFVVATLFFLSMLELESWLRRGVKRIDLVNKWVPRWAGALLRIFGVRVRAGGPHVDQGMVYPGHSATGAGRIFVSNHRSGVDIPVLFTVAAGHAISRHDLASWPIVGLGARRIGTLFVDRASRRSGADVLQEIDKSLAVGEGVGMFPEGTVFTGDEVRAFRPGAFKAAQRAGAEIVPIGIAYGDAEAAFDASSFFEHMKQIGSLAHLDVAVEVGEPMTVEGLDPVVAKEEARQRVQSLVERARHKLNGVAETPCGRSH